MNPSIKFATTNPLDTNPAMARFSDLPFELQTDIWTLVLPYRGGVHWVEFEGLPQPSHIINESLEWIHKLFDDKEPEWIKNNSATFSDPEYGKYYNGLARSSPFFQDLYATVPSVYGSSKGPQQDQLTQDVLDEIAAIQRCRQLSTYTQVTTLLSTSQISRLVALDYLQKMISIAAFPLYRGGGPMYKPRPLNIWKQQYQNIESVPETRDALIPTICGTLDLVVFRLHNASGYPKEILKHGPHQMTPGAWNPAVIPSFDRIGIEWHPLWGTPQGRKEICERAFTRIVMLGGRVSICSTQLYWLVDGIPRPQWDQYPPAIPTAFSRVIERRKRDVLKFWRMDQAWKDRLLAHHDLHQEFEANGRRYYVVFVLTEWTSEYSLDESFRDPDVSWDGPFPGGKDLWPEALHEPARVAWEVQRDDNLSTDQFCSYIMSWEPI